MTLREARCTFSKLLVKLLSGFDLEGVSYAFDEVTQHQGRGHMAGSLHYDGCAADILLYRDGRYLVSGNEYSVLGEAWKGLHPYCRWGGDFADADLGHFSFSPPELFGEKA